jgi:hypothetical protein
MNELLEVYSLHLILYPKLILITSSIPSSTFISRFHYYYFYYFYYYYYYYHYYQLRTAAFKAYCAIWV